MNITDPALLPILLLFGMITATIGFLTGSHLRGLRARREQMKLWSDAERLYRDRAILDLRDKTPR